MTPMFTSASTGQTTKQQHERPAPTQSCAQNRGHTHRSGARAIARGQAAEQQAKAAQGRDVDKYPDWRVDLAGFHAALERSRARFMEKYPPGRNLLAPALKAFADAHL